MKQKINLVIDAAMLVAFLGCGVTGILKMPELGIAFDMTMYTNLSFLHDWAGVVGMALVVVHFALHLKWMKAMTLVCLGLANKAKPALVKVKGSTSLSKGIKSATFLLALLFFVQGSQGAYAMGGRHFSNATIPQGISYAAGSLKDGVYTGTANAYMPNLNVSVTIKGGVITDVKITSHSETPRWYNAVVNVIPNSIVKAQGTEIDAVSGATCSSYGIMAAVENALTKAAK